VCFLLQAFCTATNHSNFYTTPTLCLDKLHHLAYMRHNGEATAAVATTRQPAAAEEAACAQGMWSPVMLPVE